MTSQNRMGQTCHAHGVDEEEVSSKLCVNAVMHGWVCCFSLSNFDSDFDFDFSSVGCGRLDGRMDYMHRSIGNETDGRYREYVFPGESVTVLCTLRQEGLDSEELKKLTTDYCYSLKLTNLQPVGNEVPVASESNQKEKEKGSAPNDLPKERRRSEKKNPRNGVPKSDALDVAPLSMCQKDRTSTTVAGLAKKIAGSWEKDGFAVVCIEATIPQNLSKEDVVADLEVAQYLKYSLCEGDPYDQEAKGTNLFEHFLCKHWKKQVKVLHPIKVESFVQSVGSDTFLSVTVGNVLSNYGVTSGCDVSVKSFQLLTDPPERALISQISPHKDADAVYQVLQPGTECSFAARICFLKGNDKTADSSSAPMPGPASEGFAADLLLGVVTNVSSSQLTYIHRTTLQRPAKPLLKMQLKSLGKTVEEATGLPACKLQCSITNMDTVDRTFKLVLQPTVRKAATATEEDSSIRSTGLQLNHMFVESCIPIGVIRANSARTVTCSVIPLKSDVVDLSDLFLVDVEQDAVFVPPKQSISVTTTNV
mmetsp:Transcript_4451/g.11559  ORF Transcript_4451/g.11559 Transcript_4451/m.11559 type:complete len:534 (-) Transcript_4451:132-1733(-)